MTLARIHTGDMVMVIAGRERGKTGKVLRLLTDKGKVLVEKLNLVKHYTKPSQKNKQGGIVEKEAPLQMSNVMPLCPKTHKPTRVSMKFENKKKERFAVKGKVSFSEAVETKTKTKKKRHL